MNKTYALQNDFYIGSTTSPVYHFTNRRISLNSPRGVFSVGVIGDELSVDTFSFTVRHNPNAGLIYAPVDYDGYLDTNNKVYLLSEKGAAAKDYLRDLTAGTPVWWYVSGSFFAKGYVKSVERTAKYAWKVTCISGVGLLDDRIHVGGMYTGQSFESVFRSIVGDTFGYRFGADLASVKIYNRLPYASARNNLHQLLFAVGAVMTRRNADVDYSVIFLPVKPTSVPASRIALGGSIAVQMPATAVEVTEHAFVALDSDEVVTLFDNTSGAVANGVTVVFPDAMHDLTVTGSLTISQSNCNYAVVSGSGVLTGKRYTHITTIITEGDTAAAAQRVKRVTNNELVSAANSHNVALRVLDYFSSARTLRGKMQMAAERPGMNLSMLDAFGEPCTAFLSSADVLVTSVIGASCELIEGYYPAHNGNNFTHSVVLTGTGTWTVPDDVTRARLVPIGAGHGGSGGYDGQRGRGGYPPIMGSREGNLVGVEDERSYDAPCYRYYWATDDQPVALGGAAGEPGSPGNILVADVDVTPGEVISYDCGSGGAGGARNGGAGAAGGDTTVSSPSIGTLTSADGAVSETGYRDTIGGQVFALPGESGHAGGDGGLTDANSLNGWQGYAGRAGRSVGGYAGGAGGAGARKRLFGNAYYTASGGGGGGAAWGAAGGAGGAGVIEHEPGYQDEVTTGAGGAGANALAPEKPTFGSGGGGGNGGGAGGNVGGGQTFTNSSVYDWRIDLGILNTSGDIYDGFQGGEAGQGSAGGAGGDGALIIYY